MINNDNDIIILVIASRGETYDKLINNYWHYLINYIKQNQYKIKIFLLFGNNENTEELLVDKKDMLILNVVDNLIPGILQKTIKAFEYINVNYQYKHILLVRLLHQ